MEVNLEQLMQGKGTLIKNKEYWPTEAYVSPFIKRLEAVVERFEIKVETPSQITLTKDGQINTQDITYNRVWIQGILPESYRVDNHDDVIGMVYGLDVRKPIVKFYRGGLNRACTNLCVFSPDSLSARELNPEEAIDYRPLDAMIKQANTIKDFLQKLHTTQFSREASNLNEHLGMWMRRSWAMEYDNGVTKASLAASVVEGAFKLLFEKESSSYFVPRGQNTDMFNVYNAFTELISNDKDKDIMNKVEKTLLLKRILDV
jgi:hypothetical protein